ncbi:MAG: hypothetical protein DBY24_00710 [Prevotellaceae bacterium]|nr:MAG: hypothetical protein DBY24_00710 [Prevotellaceae bacterium]
MPETDIFVSKQVSGETEIHDLGAKTTTKRDKTMPFCKYFVMTHLTQTALHAPCSDGETDIFCVTRY